MFAAVQNDAFRDGVFSHLDTRGQGRAYQSSVSQFNEGSLGAYSRLVNPSGRRAMRGFGHSFRDGSLGADAAPAATQVVIGPDGASIGPVPTPAVPYYKRPEVLVCAALVVTAAFFLYKKK
jgi:hypothetical protein